MKDKITQQTFKIEVMLRDEVLDPQGEAIKKTLNVNGLNNISNVRQGKIFELKLSGNNIESIRKNVKTICQDLLANPVIETYKIHEV